MRARALCAAALLATSCGLVGGDDPLGAAASNLGDVRSGVLGMRLVATTEGGQEAGFFLRGKFSLPEDASLPVADLSYGRLGTDAEPETTFISTGDVAYIEVAGQAYELPGETVSDLTGSDQPGDEGPFDDLEPDTWIGDSTVGPGPPIDGVETETVEGDLDVVTALNDMLDVARGFGGVDLPPIEGDEADRLEAAVRSAHLRATVDHNDLLRRLEIAVELGADAPEALAAPLEDLLGVSFKLQFSIDQPNEPVVVEAPEGALPLEELTS